MFQPNKNWKRGAVRPIPENHLRAIYRDAPLLLEACPYDEAVSKFCWAFLIGMFLVGMPVLLGWAS